MNLLTSLKIKFKLILRFKTDLYSHDIFRFSKKNKNFIDFQYALNLTQEIKPSDTFENKKFNLSVASKSINEYVIMPNELFSFWKIIGNPTYKFKKGRSLKKGLITEEIGGGLCQVAGIIYHISIIAGLQIIERHNHSIDIYTDDTRFAPLGADASVVFGYKDLRIRNNFAFPIKFEISVIENQISIRLLSTIKVEEKVLIFDTESNGNVITANVTSEKGEKINQSVYIKQT